MYVLNRIPSTVLGDLSLFEKLYGKPPSLDHMRVLRCFCFATNLTKQDKFSPRAVRFVLVGYRTTQKGYRLYDLENRCFLLAGISCSWRKYFLLKAVLLISKLNFSLTLILPMMIWLYLIVFRFMIRQHLLLQF